MRHMIFSDIHGNLEALESILSTPQYEEADLVLCLGDLVGYGADPDACVAAIRGDERVITLAGNHDWALIHPERRSGFNQVARRALDWTEGAMTPENLEYLRGLPLVHRFGDHLAVHASPYQPDRWHYMFTEEDIHLALGAEDFHACFVGHTHTPFLYGSDGADSESLGTGPFRLAPEPRYVINVGSVGQPRDNDPRASFVTFDPERAELQFFRIAYDVERAGRKIRDADLPEVLAERLVTGQ